MKDSSFQRVYDTIQPTLPEEWDKVVLYTAFMQESCEIKYFVQESNEIKFQDCFEFIDNHIVLLQILSDLQDAISEERNKLDKKEQWKFATIIINSDGHFEAFYDYSDDFWTEYDYFIRWSNTYLK